MKEHNPKELAKLLKKNQALKEKLVASKAAFLNVVGKNRDGVLIINKKGIIVYANKAALTIFGRNLGNLIGEDIGLPLGGEKTSEINIVHPKKGKVVLEINVTAIEWESEDAFLAALRDVTARKKVEETLEHLSEYDFLTDLPNKLSLEITLKKSLARAEKNCKLMALLYLDLDNFKDVNDTLGHDVGDRLLQEVADLLLQDLRKNDSVYRIGGDEFAIILDEVKKPEDAANTATKIINKFLKPRVFDNHEFFINTSIGIAIYPDAGKTITELVKNADSAMYHAKNSGRGNYQYFTPKLNKKIEQHLRFDTRLYQAIENSEFHLVYQPQMSFKTGQIIGFEALLRWDHPTMGDVPPTKFLKLAEKSGFILAIGDWVLQQATKDFIQIPNYQNYIMNINLSTSQLHQKGIVTKILDTLKTHQIKPKNFGIELTESVLLSDPEDSVRNINDLSDQGIKISIDDFGTGYSSLAYLKTLSVSYLKIDQSFVADLLEDTNDAAIVRSTLLLAHELGIEVVAEGIETREQFDFLNQHDCDIAQGFLFSKPMTLAKLQRFLKTHKSTF
ncbi:MAG: EAL domain-containing protein [Gammaproteobacteria bacterium]|nr:EAL domain-containing protein [Gammaproteobacteria bacterium]